MSTYNSSNACNVVSHLDLVDPVKVNAEYILLVSMNGHPLVISWSSTIWSQETHMQLDGEICSTYFLVHSWIENLLLCMGRYLAMSFTTIWVSLT